MTKWPAFRCNVPVTATILLTGNSLLDRSEVLKKESEAVLLVQEAQHSLVKSF